MLVMLLILIGSSVLLSLTGNSNKERVMNEYCKTECKQNIISKYKFCC